MKTKTEVKAWLASLEAERHDRSYLQPKPVATEYTKIIYRQKQTNHRFRDNVMFQAGRYSMGARDDAAINGQQLATNLIGSKK